MGRDMTELRSITVNNSDQIIQPNRVKLVIRAGEKALVLRKPGGQWDLPGGRPAPDETPGAALTRELLEETGMVIPDTHPLGIHLRLRGARAPVNVAFFGARLSSEWSASAVRLSAEHDQLQLVTTRDLARYEMPELYAAMINHWLSR